MNLLNDEHFWERSRQFVPNKRESMLRLIRWQKLRKSNRKRKSAFAFWWGPALICGLLVAGFAETAMTLSYKHVVMSPLPDPGLYVVQMTAAEVERLQRAENVRRQASALSDADVGISLDAVLPEPLMWSEQPMSFTRGASATSAVDSRAADSYLPASYEVGSAYPIGQGMEWSANAALKACTFTVALPYFQERPQFDEARFRVVLNNTGHVIEVLRFEPAGAETTQLRQVREALLKGHGTGPASGEIRVFWKTRVKR